MSDWQWNVCEGGLNKMNAAADRIGPAQDKITAAQDARAEAMVDANRECGELEGRYDSLDDAIGEALAGSDTPQDCVRDLLDIARCESETANTERLLGEQADAEREKAEAEQDVATAKEDWKECLKDNAPDPDTAGQQDTPSREPGSDGPTCEPAERGEDAEPWCEQGVPDPDTLDDPDAETCVDDSGADDPGAAGEGLSCEPGDDGGAGDMMDDQGPPIPEGFDPDALDGDTCDPYDAPPDDSGGGMSCEPPPDMSGSP